MRFNRHSELEGRHAFLSPSQHSWLNYTSQKLEARFFTIQSAQRGTDLHRLAHEAIRLGIPLHESNEALAAYVNDCVEWGMSSEQVLFYSYNCFGSADAIGYEPAYDDVDIGLLRVSDYKSGITPASPKQLEIYAGLFCLEYDVDPYKTRFELRIYQRDEVHLYEPPSEAIVSIMDKIVQFDLELEMLKGAQS